MNSVASGRMPPGHLAENVVHFARVLRAAGLPVGTDRIALGLRALGECGVRAREDMHDALLACWVDRHEQIDLFAQSFALFWRDPDNLGRILRQRLPEISARAARRSQEHRRLSAALSPPGGAGRRPPEEQRLEASALASWSDQERLYKADFETMTAQEWRVARDLMRRIEGFLAERATRRMRAAFRGRQPDLTRTLRDMVRDGGECMRLAWRAPHARPEPMVALIDISGSVSRYSRVFLHFLHALANADVRLEAFVFGTRLTRVTRALRGHDPDHSVARIVERVDDWAGGTRIAACLEHFNRDWARRTLANSPTVILMTDGLEVGDTGNLGRQAERLAKSCRRLLWLNPLLRYAAFEPRAQGIQALLPHVDSMLPVHNVESLAQLAQLLEGAGA
jgi:uncharacterized protein